MERQLAKGRLDNGHPVIFGHLIKKFIRSLPGGLLGAAPVDVIRSCGEEGVSAADARARLLENLDATNGATLKWVLRIISITRENEETNKMGVRNLALVFGPNLLGPASGASPVEELEKVDVAINALMRCADAGPQTVVAPPSPILVAT